MLTAKHVITNQCEKNQYTYPAAIAFFKGLVTVAHTGELHQSNSICFGRGAATASLLSNSYRGGRTPQTEQQIGVEVMNLQQIIFSQFHHSTWEIDCIIQNIATCTTLRESRNKVVTAMHWNIWNLQIL